MNSRNVSAMHNLFFRLSVYLSKPDSGAVQLQFELQKLTNDSSTPLGKFLKLRIFIAIFANLFVQQRSELIRFIQYFTNNK